MDKAPRVSARRPPPASPPKGLPRAPRADAVIHIRLTHDAKVELIHRSEAEGLTLTAYLLKRGLSGEH